MVGRGEETRLVLKFGSSLRSGIKDPHSLDPAKNIVFLPGCICLFIEEEMNLLTFLWHKFLPTFYLKYFSLATFPSSSVLYILVMDVCHIIL